jgi:hypothetical protein
MYSIGSPMRTLVRHRSGRTSPETSFATVVLTAIPLNSKNVWPQFEHAKIVADRDVPTKTITGPDGHPIHSIFRTWANPMVSPMASVTMRSRNSLR